MATFRNRGGKWQARVQTKGHAALSKTFINKVDAEHSAKILIFRYLTDLGNHCNMFYKQLKSRGRPPSGYTQLDLNDQEQLALEILKTLPNK
jgi:hypothetical protein